METSKMIRGLQAAVALAAFGLSAAGAATPPKPKITSAQAEAAAVRKVPGKAMSSKYEFEDGRWQYAVIVKGKDGLYEVEVSSSTGKVLDQEKTSAAEESKEAAADKAAAAKHPVK
ncbi:hypothetical protein CCAX7_57270 [Capsulimonas corticalis]|uniref:Uncharacterized protein n=1 Tax=Capsulimonas corticalis TaxID=2219043 RepID=A0A402D0B2_9BACT|nr:PepSY domain-containing protein [Capsulimonas corticalis]BDI33676.1 hypothetical protein CCAX7_57270 [Capsulimonas corticalis]